MAGPGAGELRALQERLRLLSADGRAGPDVSPHGTRVHGLVRAAAPDQLDPHFVPPEIRTALLDPSLQVQAGFARLSHGRGDDNVDGLMPDVRGLWVRLQAAVGVQDLTATNGSAELLKASRAHPLLIPVALASFAPHLAAELRRLKPAEFASDLGAHARAAAVLLAVAPSAVPVPVLDRLRVDLYAADTRSRGGHPLAEGRLFGTGR